MLKTKNNIKKDKKKIETISAVKSKRKKIHCQKSFKIRQGRGLPDVQRQFVPQFCARNRESSVPSELLLAFGNLQEQLVR